MQCKYCNKVYSNKSNLTRHMKHFHSDIESQSDNETSKEDNESHITTDDNETGQSKSSNNSLQDMDEDMKSLICELNDDETIEFTDCELINWRIIARITNLKDKLPKLKHDEEFWKNENNLQICVDTLRYGIHRLTCILKELENGEILPQIKEEIKHLREKNYTHNESWRVAFNNRKYLLMEMLMVNDQIKKDLTEEEGEDEEESNSSQNTN